MFAGLMLVIRDHLADDGPTAEPLTLCGACAALGERVATLLTAPLPRRRSGFRLCVAGRSTVLLLSLSPAAPARPLEAAAALPVLSAVLSVTLSSLRHSLLVGGSGGDGAVEGTSRIEAWDVDSRALRKTVFIPRALAGGGAVADACSAVVLALRDGAVAVFSLPKLDWLVCVAAGGIAGVGRSLRDAFAPSPVVWPTWEAAGERLVLLAESDGAVDVWHLPSLLQFARDRLHATAERAVRRASLGRDPDLAAAAEAAAAAAEPPSPPKPPLAASAADAVSIKPAIELRHAQLPAAHHAARDGAPPPVRRFEFLPAGGQATSWVGVLGAGTLLVGDGELTDLAGGRLGVLRAAGGAGGLRGAEGGWTPLPCFERERAARAARAEAAAAAARRVAPASALRGSATAPTLLLRRRRWRRRRASDATSARPSHPSLWQRRARNNSG